MNVTLHDIIGPDAPHLAWWQETDRGVIVFVLGVALLRLSGLRTFSRFSALDTVVTIIIGSNLSRTITGAADFIPTLIASAAFVLLHRLLAHVALHSEVVSRLVKGRAKPLIVQGILQKAAMRADAISTRDLEEAMRQKGVDSLDQVKTATLERSGKISLKS